MKDAIGRRHTIKTSRSIFGFAAHPQVFLLFFLAVIGAVVKIERDFDWPPLRNFVGQLTAKPALIVLQIRQLFNSLPAP